MSALRAVLIASLVATSMAVPLLAIQTAASVGTVQPAVQTLPEETNNTSQATVGEQISGFMQQQTSQAEGAVESGMWTAAYESAGEESQKATLVNQRTEGLSDEVAALQAERQELVEAREAGDISDLEFRSRMSALAGRYASLLAAINETEPRAQAVGANVSAIENLRGAATAAVGPEVAAAAGSTVVSPPGLANNTTAGPPADVPGQGDVTNDDNDVGNGVSNSSVGNGDENGVGNGNGNGSVSNGDENGVGNGDENGVGKGIGLGNTTNFGLSNMPVVSDVTSWGLSGVAERLVDAS